MVFANTNPNYYRDDNVQELDPELAILYPARTLIYYTGDNLNLGQATQTGFDEHIEDIKSDRHLTVCAKSITLYGSITIPRGDVKLYCRKLTVPDIKGLPAVINVSAGKLPIQYLNGDQQKTYSAPPNTSGPGAAGMDAQAMLDSLNKGKDPKDYQRWGQNGADGGSITIICDEIDLQGTLTLNANGGDGYPGVDGQDGTNGVPGVDGLKVEVCSEGYEGPAYCHDELKSSPTEGSQGGAGGAALGGGNGGDGGCIKFHYCSGTGEQNITIQLEFGQPGLAGQPGKGGKRGRGGKLYYQNIFNEKAVVSQAKPTDSDPDEWAASGKASELAETGEHGAHILPLQVDDLIPLGDECDNVFFLMLLQSIKYRYLNCDPQLFRGKEISFQRGSKEEWQAIGKEIDWLVNVLSDFQAFDPTCDDATKKNFILKKAVTLQTKYKANKTFYNHLPSWVPREAFDSLSKTFEQNADLLDSFEKEFLNLAKSYTDANAKKLDKQQVLAQLDASQHRNQESFKLMTDLVFTAKGKIDTAVTAYEAAKVELKKSETALQTAITSKFNCNFDTVIKALEMMAMSHDVKTAATMGAVELANIVYEGITKIKTNDGRDVDKTYVISQLASLGDDLVAGFRSQAMDTGGTIKLDEKSIHFMTQLDKLDEQVDSISGAVSTVEIKQVIQDYRNALVSRSDAIIEYNTTILLAAQYAQEAENDAAQIKQLNNQTQPFNPHDVEVFSYYAHRYQDLVDQVLFLIHQAERKYAFLTLGGLPNLDDYWKNWLNLWVDSAPSEHNVQSFKAQMTSLTTEQESYYGNQNSPNSPFPDESDNKVRLSLIQVKLPDSLVNTLKRSNAVTFKTVPETAAPKASDEVMVSNAQDKVDIRITHIRPHIYAPVLDEKKKPKVDENGNLIDSGVTASKKIAISIKHQGISRIQSNTDMFEFTHDYVETSFVHFTNFNPQQSEYQSANSGEEGKLSDSVLDMVGIYGTWTLSIEKDEDELNTNYRLDLSKVSAVYIYFKGYFRNKHK
ncbi:hypothetical protein HJG54_29585 [Leptolyngbya sp. NK1-12]|uniref:Uncharacterized protein n=1 Tax=Leptolyngbya sp. NK1-12 TaxID=2547451 RepID=A0AA96WQF1_9CYAN|nr:hypothetical protein [Leptolyngbya sp. NK1-12]WNZ27071.1 hypothetical protein HJG54_29585 [Leptolyngbya sp. NK1-12]